MAQRSLPPPDSSPATDQPTKFYGTMIICSAAPLLIALVVPEPWHGALLPLGEFMLSFVFFFGLALLLHGVSVAWHMLHPQHDDRFLCPACHTYEHERLRFNVVRIAPSLYRIRCGECGERWVECH